LLSAQDADKILFTQIHFIICGAYTYYVLGKIFSVFKFATWIALTLLV